MVKKVRKYSTSFKVVLVLLGAIAIGYFAKLFTTGTKQIILADTVAEIRPPKKHKHRHRIKNILPPTIAQAPLIDTVAKTDSVVAVKTNPIKVALVVVKPVPVKHLTDSLNSFVKNNNSFLYTTYVRANVTGIVRLRRDDKYAADIIADIPANAKVYVLKKGAMYYQVAYNNTVGFVPKWTLQTQ
ncbi:hypothetical protein [Mucilaginibacter sp. dw_454]|uniref:hypothetical protein n=1 Tax=Mucilaginibacter sp. dw_454 TaxID=2720079 RepID=UPI001BD4D18D|nr:hypothetical protein [Mucilaginibacter sp. dw_454]